MKSYKHILLATDFSELSEIAASKAVSLAGYFNARLTLLHVVEHFSDESAVPMATSENKNTSQFVMEETRERLKQFSKRIKHQGAILLVRMSIDSAKDAIIQVANETKADLIVIATHNNKGLAVFHDSTTQTVVDKARCDVLVVRAEALEKTPP